MDTMELTLLPMPPARRVSGTDLPGAETFPHPAARTRHSAAHSRRMDTGGRADRWFLVMAVSPLQGVSILATIGRGNAATHVIPAGAPHGRDSHSILPEMAPMPKRSWHHEADIPVSEVPRAGRLNRTSRAP